MKKTRKRRLTRNPMRYDVSRMSRSFKRVFESFMVASEDLSALEAVAVAFRLSVAIGLATRIADPGGFSRALDKAVSVGRRP